MTHIEFPDLDIVHAPGCPFVAETFYDPGIDCTCGRNRSVNEAHWYTYQDGGVFSDGPLIRFKHDNCEPCIDLYDEGFDPPDDHALRSKQ